MYRLEIRFGFQPSGLLMVGAWSEDEGGNEDEP